MVNNCNSGSGDGNEAPRSGIDVGGWEVKRAPYSLRPLSTSRSLDPCTVSLSKINSTALASISTENLNPQFAFDTTSRRHLDSGRDQRTTPKLLRGAGAQAFRFGAHAFGFGKQLPNNLIQIRLKTDINRLFRRKKTSITS